MYLEYRSINDLSSTIVKNLHRFPHDIDLIVGVPRSGMLPANLLALYLNKPFTDIDSFIEGKIYSSGERGKYIDKNVVSKVLVVDDSIASGNALQKAKNKLQKIQSDYKIMYAAIIATSKGSRLIDIHCEIIDFPRVFQWNIFHHSLISQTCMDIDGVLCLDPPVDDDGAQYTEYIQNAIPLYIPSVEIDTLVTCRLEKYRSITEEWLHKYNVKYKRLVMLNLASKAERIAWGNHGKFKGEVYKKSGNILFIESSLSQALQISEISNKPVFCTETFEMINKYAAIKKKEYEFVNLIKSILRPFYHAIFRSR